MTVEQTIALLRRFPQGAEVVAYDGGAYDGSKYESIIVVRVEGYDEFRLNAPDSELPWLRTA
jgi:hypothetical protein